MMNWTPCIEPNTSYVGQLEHLAYIEAIGLEARSFIQNQCTGDIKNLKVGECLFTGYCQPQGRLLATMLVICLPKGFLHDEESIVLVLPADIAQTILKRLQKYIMRSKVKLRLGEKSVIGFYTPDVSNPQKRPKPWNAHTWFSLSNHGYALSFIDTVIHSELPANVVYANTEDWIRLDIIQARPWIFLATMEKCLPQMIGLQHQGGVSFNKGCYPGQEVVARLHYRGKSKRDLYRLSLPPLPLPLEADNHTSTHWPKPGMPVWNDAKKEVGIILLVARTTHDIWLLASLLDESIHQPLFVHHIHEEHSSQTVQHIQRAISSTPSH